MRSERGFERDINDVQAMYEQKLFSSLELRDRTYVVEVANALIKKQALMNAASSNNAIAN